MLRKPSRQPTRREEKTLAALQARRWANLGRLLGFASGLFNHRVIEAARRRGHPELRPSHSHLMRSMQIEGTRITDLADRAAITKQAMSAIVAEMQALGLVQTVADPADGRAKLVRYTAKGIRLVRDVVAAAEETEAAFNRVLGPRQAAQFRRSLERLFEALTPKDVATGTGWAAHTDRSGNDG